MGHKIPNLFGTTTTRQQGVQGWTKPKKDQKHSKKDSEKFNKLNAILVPKGTAKNKQDHIVRAKSSSKPIILMQIQLF